MQATAAVHLGGAEVRGVSRPQGSDITYSKWFTGAEVVLS